MLIEVFSKDNCPFCDMADRAAQQFIQETSHQYKKFMLGPDFGRQELMEQFPGARTFPQIRIDGEAIGGWTEFEKWLGEQRG